MIDKVVRNIKKELQKRGSSVAELTLRMNVNRNYINQLKDKTPVDKLMSISSHIGCSMQDLFRGI